MSQNDQISELLARGIEKIIPSPDAFKKALLGRDKLTIYLGIDPTAPTLHLGHSVNLFLLKRFHKLGHNTVLLIGDFTARIGDPSGKTTQRKPQEKKEVRANLKNYKLQASKILNFSKSVKNPTKIVFNSKWLDKLWFQDLLGIAANFTVQQMLARDMFQRRIESGNPIGLDEFLYPIMQGYDSVALKTDVEIGGSDQLFNMLVGRDLVKKYLGKEKFVVTSKLLTNPQTGEKMSKTEGTLVALSDTSQDMYAKVMAFPDEMVRDCFELCTEVPMPEVGKIMKAPPRDAKICLAREVVGIYHGKAAAKAAQKEFERIFRDRKAPRDVPETKVTKKKINIVDLLIEVGLVSSKNEARRVIEQGGVKIDEIAKTDREEKIILRGGMLVQVGKRRFVRILTK